MYHVVDLDIKGFFDNINHTKLIRKIWALGIRDKKLLCIIKEMLKASVILPNGDKTFPIKGTPQGGLCRARHKFPYDEIDVMPRYVQYS